MAYLKIDHVGIAFERGGVRSEVLRDINLKIERGEYVAIIGHSGCGKSTLLNLVAGLLKVSEGAVLLEGREVNAPGPERAVVFQNHSLLPWLTVRENVELAVNKVFRGQKTVPSGASGSPTTSNWCTWRTRRTSARTRSPAA